MKLHQFDWLEWTSILLCGWFLFYPKPYEILFTLILILPIVGLVLHGHSKPSLTSLITILKKEDGETDYDPASFIVLPALILALRMAIDYEIESYFDLLIKGLIALVIFLFVMNFFYKDLEKGNKHQFTTYFVLIGNMAIYCFAAVYGINCVYDNSKPEIYKSVVVDKSIYSGKHTSYYLLVEPWSKNSDNNKIKVNEQKFYLTKIGDTATIERRTGSLKIPWHYID
jgi:hypothetical protein